MITLLVFFAIERLACTAWYRPLTHYPHLLLLSIRVHLDLLRVSWLEQLTISWWPLDVARDKAVLPPAAILSFFAPAASKTRTISA